MGTKYPIAVEYGDFGEAIDEIVGKTGQLRYNVRWQYIWKEYMAKSWKDYYEKYYELGVLSLNGDTCFTKTNMGVAEYVKITKKEKLALENDYDPIEAPPG